MNINRVLEENPAKIASASQEAEDLRYNWLELKEQLKRDEAKKHLTTKATNPKLTVTDLKATIESDDKLYNQRLEVITAESTYRRKETEIEHIKEELNAAKMLARIQMSEWESTIELKGKEK